MGGGGSKITYWDLDCGFIERFVFLEMFCCQPCELEVASKFCDFAFGIQQ